MSHGTVTRLNPSRSFGFVSNGENEDLFFHRSNVKDTLFTRLQVGDRVTYDIQHTDRGPRAGNVQLYASAVQLQVTLAVSDMAVSVAFYRQILGFKPVHEYTGYTLMMRGSLILGLKTDDLLWHPALTRKPAGELPRGVGVELVLEVSDIDEFASGIESNGVSIQEPLREQPWGARDLRLVDPDGYYWRITSPRPLTEQIAVAQEESSQNNMEESASNVGQLSGY